MLDTNIVFLIMQLINMTINLPTCKVNNYNMIDAEGRLIMGAKAN